MIDNATAEDCTKLLISKFPLELYSKAKLKVQIAMIRNVQKTKQGNNIVSFGIDSEGWITKDQLIKAAEWLEANGFIKYSVTKYSMIIEVVR